MHQPSKWWLGLIAVGALWVVAVILGTSGVERDLTPRAASAIAAAAPDAAKALTAVVAGRDVYVQGPEFSPGQGAVVGKAAADVYGARLAVIDMQPLPIAKPYGFSAVMAGDQFTLSGSAPLPATRDRLIAAAKAAAPNATIIDKLAYAAGAPDGFEAIAIRGVGEAAKLQGGAFSLMDKAYSIAGTATTPAIFEAAILATQTLPEGATLAKADIQAPLAKPFVWSATNDGVAATLAGFAPSIEARAAIAAAAASSLPSIIIRNNMAIASGAPPGDFVAEAGYALAELARLAKGRVSIADGAYSISGETATQQAYDAAMAGTKALAPGLTLAKADILPPELKPFVWSALYDGKAVTLSGAAPSLDARDAIARAAVADFPGKDIVNAMTLARGAPEGDFAEAASAALARLASLLNGKAVLTDAQLALSGQAPEGASIADLEKAAKAPLSPPFAVASVDIKEASVSPYVFKAEAVDGVLTLTGYAPDEKTRQAIVEAAKKAFFNDQIVDQLKIGKGAPPNFLDALKAAFGPMARLANGVLSVSDASMSLSGQTVYEKAAGQIKAALAAAMPAGFKLDKADVTVQPPGPALDPALCQPKFDGVLAKGQILFETGSATISKESAAVLDSLAALIISCRNASIEVAGHTDNVGSPDKNLDLSRRRAQAVVDYMSEAGLDIGRVAAAGYGDTKPVAPNDTPEGRAKNRRIEFIVK